MFGKLGLGAEGTLALSALNGTNGFILNGEQKADHSGVSVSDAGDVNGDGRAYLIIGAYTADPAADRGNAGKSYVVFGRPSLGAGGSMALSNLDGTNGLIINGDKSVDYSGTSVSGAGDMNGDGVADLVIGADFASPTADRQIAGKSYVVFGLPGLGTDGTVEVAALDGTTGFAINGDQSTDHSGFSVSSAGDVNGDGVSELLIGAPQADPTNGRVNAGKTYVVFGRRPTMPFPSSASARASSMVASLPLGSPSQTVTTHRTFLPSTTPQLNSTSPSLEALSPAMISTARSQSHSLSVTTPAAASSAQLSPSIISRGMPQLGSSSMTTQLDSTTTGRLSSSLATSTSVDSLEMPSLALPLGIAGGVGVVISSIAAATFALWRRRRTRSPELEPQNSPSQYAAIDSLGLPNREPIYDDLQLHPQGYSHYVGDKELQVFNREQDSSGCANLPSSHPISEYDEYESARLAPEQANDEDMPK